MGSAGSAPHRGTVWAGSAPHRGRLPPAGRYVLLRQALSALAHRTGSAMRWRRQPECASASRTSQEGIAWPRNLSASRRLRHTSTLRCCVVRVNLPLDTHPELSRPAYGSNYLWSMVLPAGVSQYKSTGGQRRASRRPATLPQNALGPFLAARMPGPSLARRCHAGCQSPVRSARAVKSCPANCGCQSRSAVFSCGQDSANLCAPLLPAGKVSASRRAPRSIW